MRIKSDRKAESVGGRGGMIRRLLDRLGMWAHSQNTQADPTPYKYQNLEEDLKRIQERLRRRQEATRIGRPGNVVSMEEKKGRA